MKLIPLSSVTVPSRQRSKIDPAPLRELEQSILERGLIHAPILSLTDKGALLVAGERRLRAIESIFKDDNIFFYDKAIVPHGMLPYTELADHTTLAEVELDENILRIDLNWQDRARALAFIHQQRISENSSQTLHATAKEIVEKTGSPLSSTTMLTKIREAVLVNEHLHNPMIAKARNATEAYGLALKAESENATAILIRRNIAKMKDKPEIEIRHGYLEHTLPLLESATFDLICADPPYGIEAGGSGFRSRTIHHHNYSDDAETARRLAAVILTEGFRLTKFRANLFLFTDIKHWNWLQEMSSNMGWTPFRTPILWQKSDSEGLAPWGRQGFRRTYEVIFYATKGQKGLLSAPVDILRVNRVPRHERIHAAEKPVELLKILIEASTLPGDMVLDPCCGSGSTLVAAKETKRKALGIEKDESYVQTAITNVHGGEHTTPITDLLDVLT